MPLYDYKCQKCGHVFEVMQKISEEPLKFCPECKGPIKRLISPVGIVFKGSGFHVTDYSRKSKVEGDKSKAGETKKTTETKSSSKDPSPPRSK